MPGPAPATIDTDEIMALADRSVDWSDKGMPPACWGESVREVSARRLPLSRFPTPLLTLSAPALRHNLATMAGWCAERGLELAPHGKTTMAPQLWAEQLAAGAWAITLANLPQLAVARAFGVSRVLVANAVISPLTLRWISDELAVDRSAQVLTWADDVRTVELMEAALAAHAPTHGAAYRPVDVLVELGGTGGRTGARDVPTALRIARAVAGAPHLRLAGVAGYEGVLSHDSDEHGLTVVRDYLTTLRDAHRLIATEALYPEDVEPVVSAGGSAYFDVVAEVLAPLTTEGVRVVLRSGAYLTHDDGLYRQLSPLGARPRTTGPALRSALHAWVRVSSQPEPGLALFDAGKRDLPFDEGLPEVQLRRGRADGQPAEPIHGVSVVALNDQHGFLRFDPDGPAPVWIGDELRLGVSHPCTAFDKWGLIPVVDDADAPDPVVVDLIRTYF
ncbi:type III PLP-dependent enzyme domain-containing protein [Microlunatus ginsengisoli]|uniref:Amino acid deaminase n=1 Tax=Microlunatus ginsengisoli TaxID=363863 RepID=A0ABP6ZM99_9ACTN